MYYVIVANPKDHSILVNCNNQLPVTFFEGDVTHYLKEAYDLVKKELNCNMTLNFLREECYTRALGKKSLWPALLIFEVLAGEMMETLDRHKWVAQYAVDDILAEPPLQLITEYLHKYKSQGLEVNGERLHPYSRVGWFDSAREWIKKNLTDAGYEVENVEKLQQGVASCVLRVKDKSGLLFYMKSSNRLGWWDEVRVTLAVSKTMPEEFEAPIAVDLERGWMLMRDYGKALPFGMFDTEANPELTKRIQCYWAEIQKKSVSKVQKLQDLGVPKVDGEFLKAEVKKMMADPVWFKAQRESMNEEQLMKYGDEDAYKREYLAFLERLFDKIAEYNVPLTLVHGDLDSQNTILRGERECKFIDMFYTEISIPFLDTTLFCDADTGESNQGALVPYLECWTEYGCMGDLQELLELAREAKSVEDEVCVYLEYQQAEESARERWLENLRGPVFRTFSMLRNDS